MSEHRKVSSTVCDAWKVTRNDEFSPSFPDNSLGLIQWSTGNYRLLFIGQWHYHGGKVTFYLELMSLALSWEGALSRGDMYPQGLHYVCSLSVLNYHFTHQGGYSLPRRSGHNEPNARSD